MSKADEENSSLAEPTANELETLRNLIYGNQARAADKRFGTMERRLEMIYKELGDTIRERTTAVADTSQNELTQLREELTARLDRQHQTLSQQLTALAQEMKTQLRTAHSELQAALERVQTEQTEHYLALQADTQERDDDLRRELLTLTAWLDEQKTSRFTLGDMLTELGEQLRQKNSAANSAAE